MGAAKTDNTPTVTDQGDNYITANLIVDTAITPPDPPMEVADTRFPWGWCTYYVASRTNVPWTGNAGEWLTQAEDYHYNTGGEPQTGAILVENVGRLGHVALVESVNRSNHTFTISEMNYKGFGIVSERTLPFNYGAIKGFIYQS